MAYNGNIVPLQSSESAAQHNCLFLILKQKKQLNEQTKNNKTTEIGNTADIWIDIMIPLD